MKKLLATLFFLIGFLGAIGQTTFSPYALLYKPSAEALQELITTQNEDEFLTRLFEQTPIDTLWQGNNKNELPKNFGVLAVVRTEGDQLTYTLVNTVPWRAIVSDRRGKAHVRIYNQKKQRFINNANVFETHRGLLKYSKSEASFSFNVKKEKWGTFLVVHQDTTFLAEWDLEDQYYDDDWYTLEMKLKNFYHRLFPRFRPYTKYTMNYFATNKPAFRSGDTVKIKAFYQTINGKPLKKNVVLKLSYWSQSSRKVFVLDTVSPYRPGAFAYQFVVADSLLGKQPSLSMHTLGDKTLFDRTLTLKNYTLDEINFTAELHNDKDVFHPNVPIKISYSALNDLGFSAMEGEVSVEILCDDLYAPLAHSVEIVPDVLLDTTLVLDPTGRGIFRVPTAIMPKSKATIVVNLDFVSANGEQNHESWNIAWSPQHKRIHHIEKNGKTVFIADSLFDPEGKKIVLHYPEVKERINGFVNYGHTEIEKEITLPYTVNFALPADWHISIDGEKVLENRKIYRYTPSNFMVEVDSQTVKIFGNTEANFRRYLEVYNPKNKLVFSGILTGDTIKLPATVSHYYYFDANIEESYRYPEGVKMIWVQPKIKENANYLNLAARGPARIYPGDTATWQLRVSGKKSEKDFDVLALAYKEEQFENSNFSSPVFSERIPRNTLKNKAKVKKRYVVPAEKELVDLGTPVKKEWLQNLQADTLPTFKYRFPAGGLAVHFVPLPNGLKTPQFAPFVYYGGMQSRVEVFYVNDQPKYIKNYSQWAYSSEVAKGRKTVKIRLRNKLLTVNNVLCKPGFKTELAIDLANLPDSVLVTEMPTEFTDAELNKLLPTILRFSAHGTYELRQNNWQVFDRYQCEIGPVAADKMLFIQDEDTVKFAYKKWHRYTFDADQKLLTATEAKAFNRKPSIGNSYNTVRANEKQIPGKFIGWPRLEIAKEKKHMRFFALSSNVLNPEKAGSFHIKNNDFGSGQYFALRHQNGALFYVANSQYAQEYFVPGSYTLYGVCRDTIRKMDTVQIMAGSKTFVDFSKSQSFALSELSPELQTHADAAFKMQEEIDARIEERTEYIGGETAILNGKATDALTGESIPFATIALKQGGIIVHEGAANVDGIFHIGSVTPGMYDVECSFLGYATMRIAGLHLIPGQMRNISFKLRESTEMLIEVEVLAAESRIEVGKTNQIITAEDIKDSPFRALRGARANENVHFIDGVKVRGDVNVPREAISGGLPAQYGDARGGVISTTDEISKAENTLNALGSRGGNVRDNFRDYAFFIPDVTTNKNGEAKFTVQYPDDIANWSTYFVGMGKGKKYAYHKTNTLAYSEVSAHLAVPRYLLAGDTCEVIGKNMNYLDTALRLQNSLVQNGDTIFSAKRKIEDVVVDRIPVFAGDSLNLTYRMQLQNGFVDGEQRNIEVLPVGMQKSVGEFYVLDGDTSVTFTANELSKIDVGVMRSTTEFLLDEIDLQLNYKHLCNEQMASKLRAAVLAEKLATTKRDKNRYRKLAENIIERLLIDKNNEQMWGWWSTQNTNTWMTAYVLDALAYAKNAGYAIDLYGTVLAINKKIAVLPMPAQVELLYSLHKAKADAPFVFYAEKVHPDSLSVSQKLKWGIIAEERGIAYDTSRVASLFKTDMLGNKYVPHDALYSLAGSCHNTLLGAEWLRAKNKNADINALVNYVLLQRRTGQLNTVNRAALIQLLAEDLTELKSTEPATFTLRWDEESEIEMAEILAKHSNIAQKVTLTKEGAGRAFASASVHYFEPKPEANFENFAISSKLFSQGKIAERVTVGEKATMQVNVSNTKEAKYVLLEIPIPGACTVPNSTMGVYRYGHFRELKGDKMYIYIDKLAAGTHTYQIELLPRYSGSFTLNPAKVELMYFPVKSGNNELQNIQIKKQ